jgi:hypothetical protein
MMMTMCAAAAAVAVWLKLLLFASLLCVIACSFDGLFEQEWAKVQNMDFESTLETADTSDELPESERAVLRNEISSMTGLSKDVFGDADK